MRSMAGMTAATLAESWEKKSIAFLNCYGRGLACGSITGTNTYEQDRNEIFSNSPLFSLQLELPELEGLVRCHSVDGCTIFGGKAEHIVCRVPTSDNVTRRNT